MLDVACCSAPRRRAAGGAVDACRAPAILSVGDRVPPARRDHAELAERLGVSEDWIVSRTGIRERRRRGARRAADATSPRGPARARWSRAGVDAGRTSTWCSWPTLTQDELMPNAAPIVAHALGADRAGAIDLGAACTGVPVRRCRWAPRRSRPAARERVLAGRRRLHRRGSSTGTTSGPRRCSATAPAPSVLGPAEPARSGAIGPIVLGADGSGRRRRSTSTTPTASCAMDGPEVYRHAVARMGEATLAAVERAGLDARGHRPVRLPPGQRQDSRARSAEQLRAPVRARRRLHREPRQLVGGHAAARACRGRARRPAAAGRARAAERVRRRLHLGRRRRRVGRLGRWLSRRAPETGARS